MREHPLVGKELAFEAGSADAVGDVAPEKSNVIFLAIEKSCLLG